jgi:hypothetical protein
MIVVVAVVVCSVVVCVGYSRKFLGVNRNPVDGGAFDANPGLL